MDYFVLDTIGQRVATCDDRDWARFIAQAPVLVRELLAEVSQLRRKCHLEELVDDAFAGEIKRLTDQLGEATAEARLARERVAELEAELGLLYSPMPEGHAEAALAAAAAGLARQHAEVNAQALEAKRELLEVGAILGRLHGETCAQAALRLGLERGDLTRHCDGLSADLDRIRQEVGGLVQERDRLRAELAALRGNPQQG